MGKFSSVGGQGNTTGAVGGSVRLGHVHSGSSGPRTPVLEQGLIFWWDMELRPATRVSSQDPTVGKLAGTKPRSMQALSDRYGTLT